MIEFKAVTKRYKTGYEALNRISFHVKSGEFIFLTGHSGAGKSSLIKLLSMIERYTRGSIIVNGQDLRFIRDSQIPSFRQQLGIIFQSPLLLNDKTVFNNVALPLVIKGYRRQEIRKRVDAALDMVGLLQKMYMLPLTLSCGEQQRVGIARAIVHRPKILIADEPTGNLDPKLSEEIMCLFEQFNQVGVTVLVASHDLNLIHQFGHRTLTLTNGRLSGDVIGQTN